MRVAEATQRVGKKGEGTMGDALDLYSYAEEICGGRSLF